MAEIVIKNVRCFVNGTDLSDHVKSATLTYSAELQDKTAMGSTFRKRIAGLKDWTATVEYNNDWAASKVEDIHWDMVGGTTYALALFANSTTAGAGNVKYAGPIVLESFTPITGAVGDLATVSITYQGSGTLTRTT